MAFSDNDVAVLESFFEYVEGEFTGDERYGACTRYTNDDRTTSGLRFSLGEGCWIEVAVVEDVPSVRVGFFTDDGEILADMVSVIEEEGETLSGTLGRALADAGLPWPDPDVARLSEGNVQGLVTSLGIDAVEDIDLDYTKIRSKVPRMVEGYMIAFGSNLAMEDAEADD